jgi:hypothetical protein
MRVIAAVAAVAAVLLLAGCDDQAGKGPPKDSVGSSVEGAENFANTGSGFDYRYAFRLPGDKLKTVLQSNADACDKLGPARCRILAMRYRVSDTNQTKAVLTLRIDPAIARNFGEAAVKTLQSADGVLTDSEVSGADTTTTARSLAMVDRLRDQLKAAQSQSDGSADAKARADRIQSALDTIAEVEASQGQTLATAPVLITYESSNALTGLGTADANFRNAGQSLENTVARVLVVLATLGPWFLVLLAIILLLRLVVHGTGRNAPEPEHEEGHEDHHDNGRHDNRNLIQRWFNRDDDNGHEPEPPHS